MIHVLVGASLPLAICAAIYVGRGFRAGWGLLVFGPLTMLVSGAIAVIPDMPRALGRQKLYSGWHSADWCNLSWGHCWIDARPWLDEWVGWPVIAMGVGALVLAVAFRELHRAEAEARG